MVGIFPSHLSERTLHTLDTYIDLAVRLLWKRIYMKQDVYEKYQTTAETVEFIQRHRKLIDCVLEIHAIDRPKRGRNNGIKPFINPGNAAALAYLFATSKSDQSSYSRGEDGLLPSESVLDFSMLEKSLEFWRGFHNGSGSFAALRDRLVDLKRDNRPSEERIATFVVAWNRWSEGEILTPDNLQLAYHENEDLQKVLDDNYTVGGIDKGNRYEPPQMETA
jgi:hypothetical protein